MIDLEEIKRHRARWEPDDSTSLPTICAHVDTLVAEVERLREHRESCTKNLLKGYETGKAEERGAVVAFVRGARLDDFADAIERGEHRREENE